MKRVPMVIGLLVCEQVIVEEGTRNVTPVNCFGRRTFASFPSKPIDLTVLAFLVEGMGEMSLEAVLQSLDNMDELGRLRYPVEFKDPLMEYRCVFRLRDFSVPRAGHYQISLIANGEIVSQRKLIFLEKAS